MGSINFTGCDSFSDPTAQSYGASMMASFSLNATGICEDIAGPADFFLDNIDGQFASATLGSTSFDALSVNSGGSPVGMWIKALDDGPDIFQGNTLFERALHEGAHAYCDGEEDNCGAEDDDELEDIVNGMVATCLGGGPPL